MKNIDLLLIRFFQLFKLVIVKLAQGTIMAIPYMNFRMIMDNVLLKYPTRPRLQRGRTRNAIVSHK